MTFRTIMITTNTYTSLEDGGFDDKEEIQGDCSKICVNRVK